MVRGGGNRFELAALDQDRVGLEDVERVDVHGKETPLLKRAEVCEELVGEEGELVGSCLDDKVAVGLRGLDGVDLLECLADFWRVLADNLYGLIPDHVELLADFVELCVQLLINIGCLSETFEDTLNVKLSFTKL